MPISRFYKIESAVDEPHSVKLSLRQAALLASLFGFVFIFLEKRSLFIRHCACLSSLVWGVWFTTHMATRFLSMIPFVGIAFNFLSALVGLLALAALALLAYHAFHKRKVIVVPLAGRCDEWSRTDS